MNYNIVEIILLAVILLVEIIHLVMSVKQHKTVELSSEVGECCCCSSEEYEFKKSRYYAVCVCTKVKNGQRVYKSFTTGDYIEGQPSASDLDNLRQNVLTANPEYKDCVIIFFSKIKG